MYSDRDIGRMADWHNDRLLNEYLDSQAEAEMYAEQVAEYVSENMQQAQLDWIDDAGAMVIYEAISETPGDWKNDEEVLKFYKLITGGEKTTNNYKLMGQAMCEWLDRYCEYVLTSDLEKEFERRNSPD